MKLFFENDYFFVILLGNLWNANSNDYAEAIHDSYYNFLIDA